MNKPQVIEHEKPGQSLAPTGASALTPMDMLDRAVAQGANVETLDKLMNLQERWEKNQARKNFDAAVSRAKATIPPIVRNATGHNSKKYVDFAAIAKVVDPILAANGLAYRFRTTQADRINVTCILFGHGHSEESSLSGPPDATGNKNAIQAIGSTLTYLQRYSLVQALGLSASDDDDGKAGGMEGPISDEQVDTLIALAKEVGADIGKFCKFLKVDGLPELAADRYADAVKALESKRAKS
jgi:hypothetical protein